MLAGGHPAFILHRQFYTSLNLFKEMRLLEQNFEFFNLYYQHRYGYWPFTYGYSCFC